MVGFYGHRAVVVGGGMSGLAIAGALMDCFEQVVVLERDRLSDAAKSRSGTPQDRQPHGLLAGGVSAINAVFPRFTQDLADAGAVQVLLNKEICQERADVGMLPRRDLGVTIPCASRPLIEWVLRRQVEASSNITLRSGCRVTAITPDEEGGARGVVFESERGKPETLRAELVIDASGRGNLMLDLMAKLGREVPETSEVGVDITYSTVMLKVPRDQRPDWKVAMTMSDPPLSTLSAVMLPMEDDCNLLLVADRGPQARRTSWDSVVDALREMITPTIYNAVRHLTPVGDMRYFGFPASVWRRYELLPNMPRGVLPMGDALCRFNPVYGQGIASAAQQARLLRDALDRSTRAADPVAEAQALFMASVGDLLQTPWNMSANADFAFPQTRGQKPERFEEGRRFDAALFRAVVADPVVHGTFVEVAHLLKPGGALRTPEMMQRIEAAGAR